MEKECHGLDDLDDKEECLVKALNWLEETLETCYPPPPTCHERARAEYAEKQE
jgi:hypothetical protein